MFTREEMLAEFQAYVNDVFTQPEDNRQRKLADILARLADTAVRLAASSLVPSDVQISGWSNEELAEAMQRHVSFRGGARLPNSAWSMMLEAGKRLFPDPELKEPVKRFEETFSAETLILESLSLDKRGEGHRVGDFVADYSDAELNQPTGAEDLLARSIDKREEG